jgi:hypothetical protein
MDRTSAGPARGYDRNRLSAGVTRRVSRAVSMDGGYLWENSALPGGAGRNDHIAIGVLNLALPRR